MHRGLQMPILECLNIPLIKAPSPPNQRPIAITNPVQTLIAFGPGVVVEVGFDPALFGVPPPPPTITPSDEAASTRPIGAPAPIITEGTLQVTAPIAIIPVLALIDTGASVSCIDDTLAQNLQLPIIDRVPIGGVGGNHILNQYLCKVTIPQLNIARAGTFIGANLASGGQMHRALVGRDFLASMLFVYNGVSGKATLAV